MDRRTLTMNWDGLGEDDDDDNFFESRDRLSTAIPFDLASSGSDDDDEFEDSRLSFVSTLSSASIKKFKGIEIEAVSDSFTSMEDYGMWMAEPGDIKERRRRLLQGMGLSSNKDLLKLKSAKIVRAISRKVETSQDSKPPKAEYSHSVVGAASISPTHPMAGSLSTSPVHPIARTNSDRPPLPEMGHMASERRKKGKVSHKKKGNSIPEYVNVPETVFALSEKPVCTLKGHQDDVLDLSWSRSQLLLSSSIDKTVRLWDVETQSCLKMFAHNDYVTCIQVNPMDDDYFISGSLDAKVRLWNIPDRKVVDWTDLHEMVTATCFTPDGQGALIGSHKGSCRVYTTTECKLEQKDNIDIQPKKNSQLKKVTGLQFAPWNPAEVLITSADSRIRIFDGSEMIYKFRASGFRNTSSQIAASFSSDGKYVISASEDSHVYIWKREEPKTPTGKRRTSVSVQAHERFQCKDVSVAIPWPGSVKNEPPLVEMHSKRHSKRFLPPPYPTVGSPTKENPDVANSKRHLPPLPIKVNASERVQSSQEEEDLAQLSRTDSGIGPSESFVSGSSSTRFGDSPSISASSSSRSHSWSSSWSQDGSNSNGSNVVQATAWGMVIVTASLGGEIRVYQNFGLPLKAGRQTNLFRDLT